MNGPKVKGWGLWSRDLGLIPRAGAGSHFWFGCNDFVPLILARSLCTGQKIPEVQCVFAHPTCSLKFPSAFMQRAANTNGHGCWARLEYNVFHCTRRGLLPPALKDKARGGTTLKCLWGQINLIKNDFMTGENNDDRLITLHMCELLMWPWIWRTRFRWHDRGCCTIL